MLSNEELLILAYFKNHTEYGIGEISSHTGIAAGILVDLLQKLIGNKYLEYYNNILKLTPKGRVKLINTAADYYDFKLTEVAIEKIDPTKAWPKCKIYIPEGFLEKL